MFWNLVPQVLIRKENPRPIHPPFPFGWWEMPGWMQHLFCYKSVSTCSAPDINIQHSREVGLEFLTLILERRAFKLLSECIPTAPVGSIWRYSVSASLISNFNCFVTPFCNLPSSTLSNNPGPSFAGNIFAPTQERTMLCCSHVHCMAGRCVPLNTR